jgi:hypothetical protein
LDLLNTYPELVAYISKGVNGEITFSDEGWDAMTEEQ